MSLSVEQKQTFQQLCNQIRRDCIELTTQSGSGHPSTCLSAVELMAWLFLREIRLDNEDLSHPKSDKYIFSKGHAAPLLYSLMLHLGYLEREEFKTFREINSRLEGHPTIKLPGVVCATGSLGQGLSVAAGMAAVYLREKSDQKVYVLMGDGEVNEGQVWEAAMSSGSQKLDNLVAIVDRNKIQQSGSCDDILDMEPLHDKFSACGWAVERINGNNVDEVSNAFAKAKENKGKPFVIIADTEKGYGVSFMSGKPGWHGKPLNEEQKSDAFKELPISENLDVSGLIQSKQSFGSYENNRKALECSLSENDFDAQKQYATREAFGEAFKLLGKDPQVWVVDGDVSNSTYSNKFGAEYPERKIEVGIAEQNMIGTAVGVAKTGKIAVANSFARFFERAYDQIEMGAYSGANFKVVGSHVGISIGADGTSQMALADCGFMRAIPHSVVLCPADFVSTFHLTKEMLNHDGFCYMRTCRGKTDILYKADESFPLGDYKVVREGSAGSVAILGCGSVLHEAIKASDALKQEGTEVWVLDAYSIKPFPDAKLREFCKTNGITNVITIEDHYEAGGLGDAALNALNGEAVKVHKLAVKDFPESGSTEDLLAKYEIDADAVKRTVAACSR